MAELQAIDAEPRDAAVIAYLEHCLEIAKAGKASSVAVAFVYCDGTTSSGYSRQHNLAAQVGSVESLKTKLVREMLDEG